MAMLDPYSPIVKKLKRKEISKICLKDFDGKYFGYLAYRDKDSYIYLKKIFIDEIIEVFSCNGEKIDTLCSVSFFIKEHYFFGFCVREKEIKLNKPVFSNSHYLTYEPIDKIPLEAISFRKKDAYKKYDGSYDNLFIKGEF